MRSFFKVKTAKEVLESLRTVQPLGTETVFITDALNRVLASDMAPYWVDSKWFIAP